MGNNLDNIMVIN